MKNIYVDIVYNEECEHTSERYSYDEVESDVIIVTSHDDELINDPDSFIDYVVGSLKENNVVEEDVIVNVREGELYKIIPSDPDRDSVEKVMDMQDKFNQIRSI